MDKFIKVSKQSAQESEIYKIPGIIRFPGSGSFNEEISSELNSALGKKLIVVEAIDEWQQKSIMLFCSSLDAYDRGGCVLFFDYNGVKGTMTLNRNMVGLYSYSTTGEIGSIDLDALSIPDQDRQQIQIDNSLMNSKNNTIGGGDK